MLVGCFCCLSSFCKQVRYVGCIIYNVYYINRMYRVENLYNEYIVDACLLRIVVDTVTS
jgi:hypothetical protein